MRLAFAIHPITSTPRIAIVLPAFHKRAFYQPPNCRASNPANYGALYWPNSHCCAGSSSDSCTHSCSGDLTTSLLAPLGGAATNEHRGRQDS